MRNIMIMVGRFDESGTAYSEGGLAVLANRGVHGGPYCMVKYTTGDYDMAWRYEQTIRKGSGCM
jgi:hypothetical protein